MVHRLISGWKKLAAATDGTNISISTNSGGTWTQTSTPGGHWFSIVSSADGTKFAASMSHGGIWTVQAPVQTIIVPLLSIGYSNNTVTLSWQDMGGWSLYQNSNPTSSNGWSPSSGVTTNNGTNYLSVSNPSGARFFRLAFQ